MEISVIPKHRMVLVRVSGEIDHHSAEIIRKSLEREIKRSSAINIAMDFSRVTFMDSSGIAVVINALRCMAKIEGKLILSDLGAQPLKVFRASGIDKLVDIKEAVL